jgi:activator of HSP90 ATPase
MPESIRISAVIPSKRKTLYNAWLDSNAHAAFTGANARVNAKVGGKFSAWDGYITGRTIELVPGRKIVQRWRTTDFPEGAPDSKLVVSFQDTSTGTRITLRHSKIPRGQGKGYKRGWREFYFVPMKRHFAEKGVRGRGEKGK